MRIEYFVKYPNPKEGRRAFTILRRVDRQKAKTIATDRTKAISDLYKNRIQDFETCKRQILAIVEELRSKDTPTKEVYLDANLDVFDKYWIKKYSRRRIDESSKHSAKCSYKRALSAIGSLNLANATIESLQGAVDKYPANKQRRLVKNLNSMLKFIGRDERLEQAQETLVPVAHLTEGDFKLVASQIEDEHIKAVLYIAFTTGLRLGEIFAINQFNEAGQFIPVFSQLTHSLKNTHTKTRTKRFAAVDPLGIPYVKKWLKTDGKTKLSIRKLKYSEITKAACRKAFPHDSEKWVRFHDLRHSYAINCLSKSIPIDLVALSLGNSVAVCQKYYVGFSLTNYQTAVMKDFLNHKTKQAA